PALTAPPRNDCHCPRRCPQHPDARWSIPDLRHVTSAPIPCVARGSTCPSANAQKWTSSSLPWHTLLALNLPGSAQLASTTQTLRRGRAWPFQANSPPNNESLQLKSGSATGTKAPRH